jgi:RNA-binding signal recognition particle 68
VLEATAYSTWMNGTAAMNKKDWVAAHKHMSVAYRVCKELSSIGELADQDMFTTQANDIEQR